MWWLVLFLGSCTVVFVDKPPTTPDTDSDTPQDTSDQSYYRMVSVGPKHVCALDARWQITCWGDDEKAVSVPDNVYTWVAAGPGYSCGVVDEDVECWGSESPGNTTHPDGISTVVAATDFACALSFSNEVVCWGPQAPAPAVKLATSIDAGGKHACAITMDDPSNTVEADKWVCWGVEAAGQSPSTSDNRTFKAVSVAKNHTCAMSGDSPSVLCLPENVEVDGEFVAVATGPAYACGLNKRDKIDCWEADDTTAPQPPEEQWGFVAASATEDWACGITVNDENTSNKVKCWGNSLPNYLP